MLVTRSSSASPGTSPALPVRVMVSTASPIATRQACSRVVHADALAGSQLAVLHARSEVSLCERAAVPDSAEDELDVGEHAGQ